MVLALSENPLGIVGFSNVYSDLYAMVKRSARCGSFIGFRAFTSGHGVERQRIKEWFAYACLRGAVIRPRTCIWHSQEMTRRTTLV